MAPRVFTHEGLPIGPSWDDVKRLLAAAEGDRPADIRDRALLMLLAVYGLRAGEVAALRLEDFDWEREVLSVPHSKSQRPRTYPLCRPVGDAVLRYLREVRPRSESARGVPDAGGTVPALGCQALWEGRLAADCTRWA